MGTLSARSSLQNTICWAIGVFFLVVVAEAVLYMYVLSKLLWTAVREPSAGAAGDLQFAHRVSLGLESRIVSQASR